MSEKNDKLVLSSPWYTYIRKIHAVFGKDPDIPAITYDDNDKEIKLYVIDTIKADAISKILPTEKTFGNVTLKITVFPSNESETLGDIYRKAFNGNPVFDDVVTNVNPYGFDGVYVLFKEPVAQFYNDCLNHPAGVKSELFEDIARDLFENTNGVYFATTCNEVVIWP